ncbi:polymerase, nucleotidyl transferase domain [Dillenia turbinata]|uniref:Polymerase, nucleotidyl transferase domain n=1 Tax=Dillenia turbinata TaxID=194707 RepID=A0AAN8UZ18_9MAGN
METRNRLTDSLTSHISLYHQRSLSSSRSLPTNPRSPILKWFSSLSPHHRRSQLTIIDHTFAQLLLEMRSKLNKHSHALFIVLPDLPSRDRTSLPTLCFRKSAGLISRVFGSNESEKLIHDSIQLFNSMDGEKIEECSCSLNLINAVTVSENFVENVDRFVEAMDGVSNDEFLRGEESGLGSDWVELKWLKAKGYYSLSEFVANRLDVALRLAWLNSHNVKKKGVTMKEKERMRDVGLAANAFWRYKGCLDWWEKLDASTRKGVFEMVLGKSAKSLIDEILKGASSALEDDRWLFSLGERPSTSNVSFPQKIAALSADPEFCFPLIQPSVFKKIPSSLCKSFNRLYVLQQIIAVISECGQNKYDKDKLFYSTLSSIGAITDSALRKLRGFLIAVSLESTKLELLGEGNTKSPSTQSKGKLCTSTPKKKGKAGNSKKQPVLKLNGGNLTSDEPAKDHGCELAHTALVEHTESAKISDTSEQMDLTGETSLSSEQAPRLVDGKVQTVVKKRKKGRSKKKNCGITVAAEVQASERVGMSHYATVTSMEEAANPSCASYTSVVERASDTSTGTEKLLSNSSCSNDTHGPTREKDMPQGVHEEFSYPIQGRYDADLEHNQHVDEMIKHQETALQGESVNCTVDSGGLTTSVSVMEINKALQEKDTNRQELGNTCKAETKSIAPEKMKKDNELKEKPPIYLEKEISNLYVTAHASSLGWPSYEWPSIGPTHFQSVNGQHLPTATDRLHLDVGHNWHNHFHQSFVPTMPQARNSPVEGGSGQILSRPLYMSLDWPPVVRCANGLTPSLTCSHEPGFFSIRRPSFQQGFTAQNIQIDATFNEAERKNSGNLADLSDHLTTLQDLADERESLWVSEEEFEVHPVSGMDYNQYFGGGVMYWNASDYPSAGFSRPPSLSSDDSSWAWHEAEMSRAVDDMVAFSSSYNTNGLTSPPATPFCSPFDPLVSGHQALGYVLPGNDVTSKVLHSSSAMADSITEEKSSGPLAKLPADVEGKTGDSLPYPILRPIIVPSMSRERSRSDFKHGHDHKSPCVPPSRREHPRIKRPPSPVVLCVPRAPRPPPPSPVGDSRKHRGFPTVRSGSSSPRHWGMRGWFHDGSNFEEGCFYMDGPEVVWPSWRNKSISSSRIIQPSPGAFLQDHVIAISQLARDQEHPDVAIPLQPPESVDCLTRKESLSLMHNILHNEIDSFCKQVAAENLSRKPYINWAVKRVTRSLQVLWPRSRTNIFGSTATGLSLPTSDVDLVVCLPPVRNLEPIKEAGILEGRNGIKETCLQTFGINIDHVRPLEYSLPVVHIPIIMLVVEVPHDFTSSSISSSQTLKEEATAGNSEQESPSFADTAGSDIFVSPKCSQINGDNCNESKTVRLDISFKSPSHTGLQTTELVKELTEQFPAAMPLAFVLKQFLAVHSLDQSYSGALDEDKSSLYEVLLITRFLQHEHHLGRPINQNFGSLLMDFLYFFGNVFDPRQMRISIRGSGAYIDRERGYSIDPIYIDDPLFPANNVGRNCFRIHQCIKVGALSVIYSISEILYIPAKLIPDYRILQAFADAFAVLGSELGCISDDVDLNTSEICSYILCTTLPMQRPAVLSNGIDDK